MSDIGDAHRMNRLPRPATCSHFDGARYRLVTWSSRSQRQFGFEESDQARSERSRVVCDLLGETGAKLPREVSDRRAQGDGPSSPWAMG
jgi:hypothetical protein